jgi:uncharacterized Ntn-hydrolase superfamily protein
MTYSIVARCGTTGQLGVAVQSAFFGAGRIVSWAEAGVGAVATQATAEVAHGPEILARLRNGASAARALEDAVASDPAETKRQLGVVDASGEAAAHTGSATIECAGQLVGDGFAAQANMMTNAGVPEAMAAAFIATPGALADRLLAALDAAQAAGGDFRGVQAAGLVVVGSEQARPGQGVVVDVRVDDHPSPLVELRRLVAMAGGYGRLEAAEVAIDDGDLALALEHTAEAAAVLPDVVDAVAFHAVLLLSAGREEEAREIVDGYRDRAGFEQYLRRLSTVGLVPLSADAIDRLVAR